MAKRRRRWVFKEVVWTFEPSDELLVQVLTDGYRDYLARVGKQLVRAAEPEVKQQT